LRRAQARLPERLGEVMADTIGDDQQTRDTIVGAYRAKFPEPEPEQEEPDAGDGRNVRKIGAIDEESTPEPPVRRSPGGSDDEEDFGQSFITRG
jgi:hypothetical protein